ncbi:GNAT family N-acetyltransferase [Scytonema sp. NUACC26]|uniref:GNAT family N-acetyltransferase n=1 Tax=Scytonema sp. NUACC26 TaxID=3140176 RepID=UPI0034DBA552
MPKKIYLNRSIDNSTVEATIVNLATKHVEDFENQWAELLRQYKQQDKFWDLMVKLRMISRFDNYEGYAVEYENQTEGLLVIETTMHGSQITLGKRLVYIYYIATAPLNRKIIQNPPKLQGIGTSLLLSTRERSLELGYEGRVGLHSLPGYEKFYDNRGMYDLGPDEDLDELVYFEYGLWRQRL